MSNIFSISNQTDNGYRLEVNSTSTIIRDLVLLDEKTGKKYDIKIYDGKLVVEPHDLDEKRNFKIKSILD